MAIPSGFAGGVGVFEELDSERLDTLQEICSIGAGHAATALSQMIGRTVDLEVPRVAFENVRDLPRVAGGADGRAGGLYFTIFGDARGVILLIFPEEGARRMVHLVCGGHSTLDLDDAMGVSAMREIGNILASAFLSAISQLSGLNLVPSVPGYCHDTAGSIFDLVLKELPTLADAALVIEAVFGASGEGIRGHFFLLPDPHTLEVILRAVERTGSAGSGR